jgi:hypothetical protein
MSQKRHLMNADATIRNVVKPFKAAGLGGDLALEDLRARRAARRSDGAPHPARTAAAAGLGGGRQMVYMESFQLVESEHVQLKSMNILYKLSYDGGSGGARAVPSARRCCSRRSSWPRSRRSTSLAGSTPSIVGKYMGKFSLVTSPQKKGGECAAVCFSEGWGLVWEKGRNTDFRALVHQDPHMELMSQGLDSPEASMLHTSCATPRPGGSRGARLLHVVQVPPADRAEEEGRRDVAVYHGMGKLVMCIQSFTDNYLLCELLWELAFLDSQTASAGKPSLATRCKWIPMPGRAGTRSSCLYSSCRSCTRGAPLDVPAWPAEAHEIRRTGRGRR